MEKYTAEKIFRDAKYNTERAVKTYTFLKNLWPLYNFPQLTNRIWREGMLAEIWGTIATRLSTKGINYLDEWRQGR